MRTVEGIRQKYEGKGLLRDDYKNLTSADIANMRLDIKFLLKQYKKTESAIKETCDTCTWDDTQVCAVCRFGEWKNRRSGMACNCAKPSDENHGWECGTITSDEACNRNM